MPPCPRMRPSLSALALFLVFGAAAGGGGVGGLGGDAAGGLGDDTVVGNAALAVGLVCEGVPRTLLGELAAAVVAAAAVVVVVVVGFGWVLLPLLQPHGPFNWSCMG
jgi:hypothetical protein